MENTSLNAAPLPSISANVQAEPLKTAERKQQQDDVVISAKPTIDTANTNTKQPSPASSPNGHSTKTFVPRQPPAVHIPHFAIDVECVATGARHDQRAVAQIALVDQWERVVFNVFVKPEEPVVSYLYDLTGLSAEALSQGVSLDTACQWLRKALPKNAILVGQSILNDVNWLKLVEGVDFAGLQDLNGLWRVHNAKFNSFSYFSLHHQAKALLGLGQEGSHDAAMDAFLSMRLFNLYKRLESMPSELDRAKQSLLALPVDSSFAKKYPTYDGVCMGNKKTCTCGAPFLF